MNNLKDIYNYNKKTIWIGIVTFVLLIIGLIIYFQKDKEESNVKVASRDEYNLVLFGSDMEIYQNDVYREPGYYAILNNEIVTDQVIVNNALDNTKPGIYDITYTYRTITKTRTITVLNNSSNENEINSSKENNIKIKLNGDSEITLKINEKYIEQGAKAYDSNGNDISNNIKTEGTIDTNQEGSYKIKYSITQDEKTETIERIVNVVKDTILNITKIDQTKYTKNNITLTIESIGSNFLYMKFPDNTVSKDSKKDYVITENGTYTFYAYNRDNSFKIQSITIKNIDKIKPSGTCTATISNAKTIIKVSAQDNVGIDHYLYNGTNTSTSNSYTFNSTLSNAKVSIYDKAGNVNTLSCKVVNNNDNNQNNNNIKTVDDGNIEMHFMVSGHDDDAVLIRNNKYTIMIDGGRYDNKKNIIPYLQNIGVKNIDLLIGSHVHWNHIQSHAAIIENFKVSKAIYSLDIFNCQKQKICDSNDIKYVLNTLKSNNIPTEMKAPGDYIELGEIKIYFLGPLRANKSHNANSFIFILKYRNTSYMFTGDTESKDMDAAKIQANANKWNLNIDVDFLKWPHHGYNNLNDAFFKATTPKYIFIPSSGCSTTYPSNTDKKLIKKYGSTVYSRCDKNVVLISDGNNIDIKTNQNANDYKR